MDKNSRQKKLPIKPGYQACVLSYYIQISTAPIQHKGLWPTFCNSVHANATHGGCTGSNLAYCSAIYPLGITSEYGLVHRLLPTMLLWNILFNFFSVFCC